MTETSHTPVPDPRDRTIWALRRAELAVQALKDRHLRDLGMAASHYALLATVNTEPGLTGAALARRLGVTPQAVASLVARLEGRGQVERRPHPRHTQVHELHLTDDGHAALEKADAVMTQVEQQVVDTLGADENRRLRSALETLASGLRPA